MEENTNMTEQTQAGNMGNETEGQGADQATAGSGKEQKLFTQEEVNSFVQSRVSRLKSQINKEASAEYNQKLAELQARESKLMVKEALHERNMPRELADIITCTDENDIKEKLDALQKIYGGQSAAKEETKPTGFVQIGAGRSSEEMYAPDPVRKAMGLTGKD